jgi:hypothetical protein
MLGSRRSACALALAASACAKPAAPVEPVAPTVAVRPVEVEPPGAEPAPAMYCSAAPTGRIDLVPSEASMVGSIDLASLGASPLFTALRQKLLDGELKSLHEAAQSCDVGLPRWHRVTFGTTADSNDFATVIQGEGIGRAQNVACLGEAIARKDGKAPWTMTEGGDRPRYELEGRTGWIVDECTVVLASTKWTATVEELLRGNGKSVLGGPLEPAIRRTTVTRSAWFAGIVPATTSKGSVFEGAADVAASVDIASGFALSAAFRFTDPGVAGAKAIEMRKKLVDAFAILGGMGLPQSVLDRIRIEAQGSLVVVEGSALNDELGKLREALRI